jgi:amino acid transporter
MAEEDGWATAVVEERQLLKAMSWWDGFMVALANPGFLVAALGGSIAGLGTLGATIIWTISVVLGMFQNSIYAELATMFPTKSGGISLFAHEAWRKYFSPVGALATFGYWFAWSTVLSISGLIAGTLLHTQFFPKVNFSVSGGHFHLDLPTLIGVVFVCLVWFFGARGIRSSVIFSYVTGILLMIPLFVMMFLPYATGAWHSSNLQWHVGSGFNGFALVVTWLYFMGWSSYGFESVAAFAPEYRNTRTDTPRALYASAAFSVVIYALLPLGLGGTLSTQQVASDPTAIAFYATALDSIAGHTIGNILVLCLVGGIVLTMETATMDGSRALRGIALDGMTIKWLGALNRHNVPGRGMMVDGVLNIFLIVFFGSAIQIIAAGNLGYILSHVFALIGFLLLRKDRPRWPRPIRRSAVWLPIAGVLALANLMFVVLGGFVFANKYGYGLSKTWVGVAVLCISMVLYCYRKLVEDRQRLGLRQQVPQFPSGQEAEVLAAEVAGS